jgi:hypothetical protein
VCYISGDAIQDLSDVAKWNLENPDRDAELDLVLCLEEGRYGRIASSLGVLCECEDGVYFYEIDKLSITPDSPIEMFENCTLLTSGDGKEIFGLRYKLGYALKDGDFVVYDRDGAQHIIKSEENLEAGQEYFAPSLPSKFVKILVLPNGQKYSCEVNNTFEWHFESKVEIAGATSRSQRKLPGDRVFFDVNGCEINVEHPANYPEILVPLQCIEEQCLLSIDLNCLALGPNNTLIRIDPNDLRSPNQREAALKSLWDLFAQKPLGSWIETLCKQVPKNVEGQLSQDPAASRAASSTSP